MADKETLQDIERLEEIREEIKELIQEAKGIFNRYSATEARFKGYPYARILTALDNDHEFLGGSLFTFLDCIEELKNEGEEE